MVGRDFIKNSHFIARDFVLTREHHQIKRCEFSSRYFHCDISLVGFPPVDNPAFAGPLPDQKLVLF
jgi:hypothetical protein